MESRKLAVATTTSHGFLPLDVLIDVLVRLPAKEICRFRAVCRPWWSLTSDPVFIKAHAARHPGPLIVASYRGDHEHVHVMNLSGHVIKRVPIPSRDQTCLLWWLPCSRLDLIWVTASNGSCCSVINPATGAVSHLAGARSLDGRPHWSVSSVFALGRVDSTGEYKMLMLSCISRLWYDKPDEDVQFCSVVTVNGAGGTGWRRTVSPPFLVDMDDMDNGVVVGCAVYYLRADACTDELEVEDLESDNGIPNFIASFNFEREDWTTIPFPCLVDDDSYDDDGSIDDYDKFREYIDIMSQSSLAELKGFLVLAHNYCRYSSTLNLWFLTDIKNGLWVKEYSIQAPKSVNPAYDRFVRPLLLLDDGRIVIFLPLKGELLLYDPMTNVFSEVETRCLNKVGLYTGSLLSLQRIANL